MSENDVKVYIFLEWQSKKIKDAVSIYKTHQTMLYKTCACNHEVFDKRSYFIFIVKLSVQSVYKFNYLYLVNFLLLMTNFWF